MATNKRKITGGPEALNQASKKIAIVASDFQKAYSAMYAVAQNDLANVWKGPDCDAFMTQLASQESKYKEMYNIISEYANLLRQSAEAYEDQINDVSSMSRQISIC